MSEAGKEISIKNNCGTPTKVRIGMLGFGNVASALMTLIEEQHSDLKETTNLDIEITRVAVRDANKSRDRGFGNAQVHTDPLEVIEADDVDVVIELVGGVETARTWIKAALKASKSVVTGNKALLAAHGAELFKLARENKAELFFEASVAGAIPMLRVLQKSLRGEPIERIMGIVNGTTNYMLSKMTEQGVSYADVLAEAQALGFAEADPSADVGGFDAQAKAAIIASVAFGVSVTDDQVSVEGIESVTAQDIARAQRLGYVIKLLAVVERFDTESDYEISARVYPAMVPFAHPLASVRSSFNAVFIEGGALDELMLYGRGAGGRPTASAVLGDVIEAAEGYATGVIRLAPELREASMRETQEAVAAYSLDIHVDDRPGVLSEVSGVFGNNGVSIRSLEQTGLASEATLSVITHPATEASVTATLEKLGGLACVTHIGTIYRVIGVEQ